MRNLMHVLRSLAIISCAIGSTLSQSFSFSATQPTQCDNMSVQWSGGVSPYVLTLAPVLGTPRNITFASGTSGTVPIPFASGQKMVIALSDATGFATGGTSAILTVGNSQSGTACNTTDIGPAYTFDLDSSLLQCQPYPFTQYGGAIQPITVHAFIPSGESFILQPPISSTNSFNWLANIQAGTTIMFSMVDSAGRQGGDSNTVVALASNDATCLTSSSPSVTAAAPGSQSTNSSANPSKSTNTPSTTGKTGISGGAIAGMAAGGIVGFLAIFIGVVFYLKRKRSSYDYTAANIDRIDEGYIPAGRYNSTPYTLPNRTATPPAPAPLRQGQYNQTSYAMPPPGSLPPGQYYPTAYAGQPPTAPPNMGQVQYPSRAYTPPSQPPPSQPSNQYNFNPYALPPPAQQPPAQAYPSQSYNPQQDGSRPTSTISATAYTATSVAGGSTNRESYAQPQRVIVHSDIAEGDDQILELPPQYSESRAPIEGLTSPSAYSDTAPSSSTTSASSSTPLNRRAGKS